MRNPYLFDGPTAISLSGGRSSGFMTHNVIEAHGGSLPDHIKAVFANTGKEMPQTLDFVQAIAENWGIDITWIELESLRVIKKEPRNEIVKTYKVVDYDTASRNGEPFNILLDGLPAIPNVRARTCTAYMKMRGIQWYLDSVFGNGNYSKLIGIRADEQRRAAKMRNQIREGALCILPMVDAGHTVSDVSDFWKASSFDLALPNNGGVTDWGNCDLCFLKAKSKKLSIIRERPDLLQWWIDAENSKPSQRFRSDHPTYEEMDVIASEQPSLFDFDDDHTIPCFCGD